MEKCYLQKIIYPDVYIRRKLLAGRAPAALKDGVGDGWLGQGQAVTSQPTLPDS